MSSAPPAVLVIDDDAATRDLLSRLVGFFGFDAISAPNGLAGVRAFLAERDRIACVLLDAVMPVMGGADALREMRQNGIDVPVFVVSGQPIDSLRTKFAAAAPEEFVHKPCTGDTLLELFQRFDLLPEPPARAAS